ncbi:MAG: hypothetical protein Q8O68_01195 [Candidatus Daviesbacteria bacterium]|nr:hypothetical protein [Candidatus Daviesbacteria bacterium]
MPGIFPNTIPDTETTYEARAKENEAPVAETDIPISKGYQLTIPKGVHYALMRPNKAETYRDPNLVYTILTYYYDPINDITIRLTYESTGFVPSDGQKTYSWDGGEYNKLYNPAFGGNFENLPISDGESPLTKPASGNETLRMFAVAASGKIKPFTNLPEALAQYRKIQWEKIVDQNQKLILISSK